MSKVTSLTIGIEGAGSKGILYVDDIRLYPLTPQYITPVDPGKANLVALWALDGDAKDSSGKGNNGTVNGTAALGPRQDRPGAAIQRDFHATSIAAPARA